MIFLLFLSLSSFSISGATQDLFNISSSSVYFYHFQTSAFSLEGGEEENEGTLTLPFHLKNHVIFESDSICKEIAPLCNYSYDECLSLNYQSHRTLRQSDYESYLHKYSLPKYFFSLFLGYSYAFETCSDLMKQIQPIDVCFIGNISPAIILMAILSCDLYQITVLNFNQNQLYDALMQFQLDFPHRSIRWIFGSYTSYFPPNAPPPHCNVIIIDETSSLGFANYEILPIPSPVKANHLHEEDSLLLPCRGNGLVLQYHSMTEQTNGASVLAAAYKKLGISIDWRMETISTDFSDDVSIRDYEGLVSTQPPLLS
jgi:hypothetical protein